MRNSEKGYKILVVAPGSIYSTFDIYSYYLDSLNLLDTTGDVIGFAFQNIIEYHHLARIALQREFGIEFGTDSTDIMRAIRELLIEIIYESPDVVFFIDGTKFNIQSIAEFKAVCKKLGRNTIFAVYMTESPYIEKVLTEYRAVFDVQFLNERPVAERLNPTGNKFVHYLPHSYSPLVHYPFKVGEEFQKDVFFCGTYFPERAKLLSGVNWTGIDALLCGSFDLADKADFDKLDSYGIVKKGTIPNKLVADYYRGAKICLNLNRTFGWTTKLEIEHIAPDLAYSVGPRIIEAAACGAFIISEPRPELLEIFGDSVPTFTTSAELENLMRYYLTHEDKRLMKAEQSLKAVQSMTYNERAKYVDMVFREALEVVRSMEDKNG